VVENLLSLPNNFIQTVIGITIKIGFCYQVRRSNGSESARVPCLTFT